MGELGIWMVGSVVNRLQPAVYRGGLKKIGLLVSRLKFCFDTKIGATQILKED